MIEEKKNNSPACLYFFKPITVILGGVHSCVGGDLVLLVALEWVNLCKKISARAASSLRFTLLVTISTLRGRFSAWRLQARRLLLFPAATGRTV